MAKLEPGKGADRVRIEYETDGQVRTIELTATDDSPITFNLESEYETRELPPVNAWREFAPTGRVRITLGAFGPLTPRELEG
jgi:hypothetical protein